MIDVTLTHPRGLRSTLVDQAADIARAASRQWLDDDLAVDLLAPAQDADALRALLQPLEDEADITVQPVADRARKLLMADMDSTMITVECLDELADYAGMKEQVAEITTRAMRGELDFAGALKARVALLSGLEAAMIERCIEERVRPAPGGRTLVATLAARGVRTALVSGGFMAFAEPVAKMLGFDVAHANRLEIRGGVLTGRVVDPILGAEAKRHQLMVEARALGIETSEALAIGDGANDIPMLQEAGLGIAIHAKPSAAAAATTRIQHGDLTSVLWAMGIARRDWVLRD